MAVHLTSSGISMPASQSASGDANTMDDYEEGTFTATFRFGGTSGASQGSSTGKYTKVGNTVYYDWYTAISNSVSGGGGQAYRTGLPFSVATGGASVPRTNDRLGSVEYLSMRPTGTSVAVYKHPVNDGSNLTNFGDSNWVAGVGGKGLGSTGHFYV